MSSYLGHIELSDFANELEKVSDGFVELHCQVIEQNKLDKGKLRELTSRLADLSDAVVAEQRLYNEQMDKWAKSLEDKEFEESIGDPNGLRNDDGQAVS